MLLQKKLRLKIRAIDVHKQI